MTLETFLDRKSKDLLVNTLEQIDKENSLFVDLTEIFLNELYISVIPCFTIKYMMKRPVFD